MAKGSTKAKAADGDEVTAAARKAAKAEKKARKAAKEAKKARKEAAKEAKKARKEAARAGKATGDVAKAHESAVRAERESAATLASITDLLRVGPGFRLADLDPAATPGFDGSRGDGEKALAALGEELSDLQERLYAHGRSGGDRSVLLVLQGLDTAGKGGIVRHVLGLVDRQGVALRSFGVPTAEEREHHYLWRIRRALPPAGRIGVFDRSHYEDVLVVRVDELVEADVWQARYDEINRFEAEVAAAGTTIVKVALWVSSDEQYARLRERLERPDKHWKYNPSDVDVRAKRPAYEAAYQDVLDRTSTDVAPWHVVPADNKWYARLAVSALLHRALTDLDLGWPAADFDVATELARLDATR